MKLISGQALLAVVLLVTNSLWGCVNNKPNRYQIIDSGGITEVMDMKTLDVYYSYGANWHKVNSRGVETIVSELPQ
jgi:hypothetical protein